MKKHINSATEQYQDEYTDNWVLDDTPTKGSYNGVTSDGVATAIEQGGGSSYEAGDGISIADDEISVKVDGTTIQVNASGELEAIGGGGSSGYTPVDLDPITEGPYTIPVGNREDVYVQISGYTSSTILNIQLANDCTDAIVTVDAASGTELAGIQVSRGNTNLQIFGRSTVVNVNSQYYANNGRVLLTTVDGDSAYEPPSDFSEIEVDGGGSIIGEVEATYAYQSLHWTFSVEIKGRCAILHK